MVSYKTITALLVSGLLCFLVPLIIFLLIRRRSKHVFGPLFAGILSFYLLQVVIRIPILQLYVSKQQFFKNFGLIEMAIFLGFTAALFETLGRYFTIKFLLSKRISYYGGIAHGIGHGGIEAIILVGVNYLAYIYMGILINKGGTSLLIEKMGGNNSLAIDQLTLLSNTLINEQSIMFITGGLERIMTLFIHIGFSVLIMEGICKNKKLENFLIVLSLHTILDFSAVILAGNNVSIYLIELFVLLFSIVMIAYTVITKKNFKDAVVSKIENEKYINSDY